jgi:hypothetical protein
LLSAVTRVELSCVIEGRKGDGGRAELLFRGDDFIRADVRPAMPTAA